MGLIDHFSDSAMRARLPDYVDLNVPFNAFYALMPLTLCHFMRSSKIVYEREVGNVFHQSILSGSSFV